MSGRQVANVTVVLAEGIGAKTAAGGSGALDHHLVSKLDALRISGGARSVRKHEHIIGLGLNQSTAASLLTLVNNIVESEKFDSLAVSRISYCRIEGVGEHDDVGEACKFSLGIIALHFDELRDEVGRRRHGG